MEVFMEKFEDLRIQLAEIISATNNFHKDNLIGNGGFGMVYKGELPRPKEQGMVAFKRLDRRYGQGDTEFLKEITMLSRYRHENLISLIGFCNEGDEMILAYEHASNGSLDCHLKSPSLTWIRRLKICLQAAKGLRHLHDPKGSHQRIIHRDIKSANILLDKEWNAKVSDFGLSKMAPANEQTSYVVTNATGTLGYCDPMYLQTYTLTKESDVYSFGVVLFEVLCGKLCYKRSNGQMQVFVSMWKEQYNQHKLQEIIFHDLKQQINATSFEIFTDIAYECLRESRKERPTMSRVVEKLDIALQVQEATPYSSNSGEYEYEESPRESPNQPPQESHDLLIKCIKQDIGFSNGKPVAACLIYNCLLHWRSFEAHSTTIFERITQTITLVTKFPDSNHALKYWLCNTSTLLALLTRTFKASSRKPTFFFAKTSQKLKASPGSAGRTDDLSQVEAEYPALLFKSHLTDLVINIYAMMRDNLKKELSPMLDLCIRAVCQELSPNYRYSFESTIIGRIVSRIRWNQHIQFVISLFSLHQNFIGVGAELFSAGHFILRKFYVQILKMLKAPGTSREALVKDHSHVNAASQQTLIVQWQRIVKYIDNHFKTMKANFVTPILVRKVSTQIFSFINNQLFNSLLSRRECCSFVNGEYLKVGLAELEQWIVNETEEYAGTAWHELKYIRQAVTFLVTDQKPKITLEELFQDICPALSLQQLHRICTMYWDEEYGMHSVSSEVISSIRVLITEDMKKHASRSFLLDDESNIILFDVDEISMRMPQVDTGNIEYPPLIRENSVFAFLHQEIE